MQFIILVLAIYWWLNLVSILLITCFAIFCINVTRKLNALKSESKLERMLEDTRILKLREMFAERVRSITLDGRFVMWNMQFLLVTFALIIIYPSEFLLFFEKGGASGQQNNAVRTLIYYMFLAGVYHEDDEVGVDQEIYYSKVNVYLVIMLFCMVERICLSWKLDRFGCDDFSVDTFDSFERRLEEVDARIETVKRQLKQSKAKGDDKMTSRATRMRQMR